MLSKTLMTILSLLVAVAIIVFALWLVQTYLPAPWKTPVLVIIVLLALVFLLTQFFPGAATTKVK